MKPTGKKKGFTIIELLTVMSIIIILISLLVPSLNRVRRVAKGVAQRAQFYDIEKALEEFRADNDDEYPDSGEDDTDDPCRPYCGAMKLCEAMIGQDGMGLHEDSVFFANGEDMVGNPLYLFDLSSVTLPADEDLAQKVNRGQRIKYLESDDVGRAKLAEMFTTSIAPFETDPCVAPSAVLCDVFVRTQIKSGARLGEKVGMPVLYYKADVRKQSHNVALPDDLDNIYDYKDNMDLVDLGLPWDATGFHPINSLLGPPPEFYELIQNEDIITTPTPYKKNQYILISAGYDGRYGTRDDIFNFRR